MFTLLRSRRCDKQDVCFDISVITNYDGPVNYESFFGQMCPNFPLFFYSFFAKRFFYFEKNCTCYNILLQFTILTTQI